MSLVWNGQRVPGTERVISFLDDPTLPNWEVRQKRREQSRRRRPQEPIGGVGIHTWRAAPAGFDPKTRTSTGLVPYAGQRLRAREVIRIHAGSPRAGAYHLYVDHDGTIYQCADPVLRVAYHGAGNGWAVGIGMAQGTRKTPKGAPDFLVTLEAVDAAGWLTETLWPLFAPGGNRGIPFCGWNPRGRQTIPVPVLQALREHFTPTLGGLVLGHCHTGRKTHDPGQAAWERLGARPGWRRVWPEAA